MVNRETIKLAFQALAAHKLRSFLTLLGVIIGVASVIAVVSVIQGLNQYMTDQISQFGTTTFSVNKFSSGFKNFQDFLKENKRPNLTMDDFEAITAGCKHCQFTGAVYGQGANLVKYKGNEAENVGLRGVSVNEPFMGEVMELSAGRHFTSADIDHGRNITILGGDTAERLFQGLDPIGKEVNVDGSIYEVVGVAVKKGDSLLSSGQDAFVRLPVTTFIRKYGVATKTVNIDVQVASDSDMTMAMEEVRTILRNRHHLTFKDPDNFAFTTADALMDIWRGLTGNIFMVTVGLASIALVVGGIVIMNIMLVSVTERTREIGVRKALGARRSDILGQFLCESVVLSAIGGLLGIALGVLAAFLITKFTPLPMTVKMWAVGLAFTVASSVGLFFGIYPASRAARLDPVVALRAE
jgi:putative ABC transport system permease protein